MGVLNSIPLGLGLCDKGEEAEEKEEEEKGLISPRDTAGRDDVKRDLASCKRDSRSAISFSRSVVSGLVSMEREPFLSSGMAE